MDEAVRGFLFLAFGAALMTALAALAAWWLDPPRRVARRLAKVMGGPPDTMILAAPRGQGAGLRMSDEKIGMVNGFEDRGLLFDLDELVGAELFFDGQVAARNFRGEPRRALDQISPNAGRVTMRLVFDDVHHPAFEMDLWRPEDAGKSGSVGGAVLTARDWMTRIEGALRRPRTPVG